MFEPFAEPHEMIPILVGHVVALKQFLAFPE